MHQMTTQPFIHDDFLLQNETARRLYHDYAAGMPIMDYHCHLPPAEVAEDVRWDNIAQVWRPLQVAHDALQRDRGALLYGECE